MGPSMESGAGAPGENRHRRHELVLLPEGDGMQGPFSIGAVLHR
ncbi:hypothetical protein ABZY68_00100 [Streptomyces sp. NPDC006482]